MIGLLAIYWRWQILTAITTTTPPLLIVTAFWIAKPDGHAAAGRFAIVAALFLLAAGGLVAWAAARRHTEGARIALGYHGAPSAIRNTVRFLQDERRAATRGVLPALVAAILLAGLATLAAWPQLAVLAPYRGPLAFATGVAACLALLAPCQHRRNLVNTLYLSRYLRQQQRHIGFRPPSPRAARRTAIELARPAVTRATGTGFQAAGFAWKIEDLWTNCVVLGQPGSGKTVTVLNTLLEGMFAASAAAELPAAGVIIDPKGDFKRPLVDLARHYGRADDIVILSATDWDQHGGTSRAIIWNPLDSPDDGLEIAARLVKAAKMAGVESKDTFFLDSARSFLRHGIEFIRAGNGNGPPSLLDLRRLATEFSDEAGFYMTLSKRVLGRYTDDSEIPSAVNDAVAYFENEYRRMPERQRGGLIGTITQLIDEFSIEPFREMMSGRSTISISSIIDQGKIFYIDLPAADRPRMATLGGCLIKLEFQREILRRVDKARPSFMLADEFPVVWSTGDGGDADFFALSRASRHANIVAAQNISAFYKKSSNKDEARNFLGNCAVKIFLRNTETETNAWASKLFGNRSEFVVTANETASLDEGFKRGFTSYSRSTAMVSIVPPEAFSALAIPERGTPCQFYAESIVHLASRTVTQKLELSWRVNPL